MGKWPMVKLGEVLEHRKEFVMIDDLAEYKRCRVQLHAQGIVLRDLVSGAEIKTKKQQVCKAGDFLVAEIDAKVGGYGIVPDDLEEAIVSSHYFLFTILEHKLDRRFLGYFTKTPYFQDQVTAQGSTNYAAIRPAHVLDYIIPLPPLAEQRRIVARIDALAAKIDETRGLRKQAGDEAEAVRTSGINEVFSTLGKTVRPMPLEALSDCRLGKMLSQNLTEGSDGTPYLRNANVQWDYLDLSSIYRMKIGLNELQTYLLHPGDILVCEGGDIGKSAIFNGEIEGCIFQKALHRVRVFKEKAIPRFILYHIFWGAAQGHFSEIKTQTTIAHLTGVKLKKYGILCPPIPEQRRIVTRLDALQAQVDVLKQAQAASAAELDALLPSVLDRAFKGEAT